MILLSLLVKSLHHCDPDFSAILLQLVDYVEKILCIFRCTARSLLMLCRPSLRGICSTGFLVKLLPDCTWQKTMVCCSVARCNVNYCSIYISILRAVVKI